MSWILVAALAAGSPAPGNTLKIAPAQAAEMLATDLPHGSLLFSQGDCLAVKVYTASRYTHVGAVVERAGGCYVYDSTGGAGVRELPLAEYLATQGKATVSVYHPEKPMSARQRLRFEEYLESQVGRPYSITHHLTGHRADGLHCAEYVTDALIAGELLEVDHPPKVSPARLKLDIESGHLYRHTVTLQIEPPTSQPPEDAGWCSRLWFDTKACSRSCYRKLSGWFCCK